MKKRLISVALEISKLDKSIETKSKHSLNIPFILVALFVINLSIPFISFNLWHLLNIPAKLLTFDVSKFDKSKDNNLLQPINIALILLTLLVWNRSNLFISINLVQPLNILYISVTSEVLIFKITEFIFEQSSKNRDNEVILFLKINLNSYLPSL